MVILKFALKRSFRNPIAILASFVLPIGFMLIPTLWGADTTGGFAPDGRGYYFIALVMMFGTFPLTGGMLRERREKTIVRIMSTPTTTFSYLAQNLIACMIPFVLQIIAISTLSFFLHDWTVQFSLLIGLCYLVFASTSVALPFAWNCLFKSKETSFTVQAMFLTFASFILLVPLSLFSDAIRTGYMIFPTYWIASALEELVAYGATMKFGISLGIMGLFTAIFLLFGSKKGAY